MDLAIAEPLVPALELEQAAVDVELLLEHALLDLGDLDSPVLDLALDLARSVTACSRASTCASRRTASASRCASASRRSRSDRATLTRERDQPTSTTEATTAPTMIPMSAAPAESMEPPVEGVVGRGAAAGALTRPPTCTVGAGLCSDVYLRWWWIPCRRAEFDRLDWLIERKVKVKGSESVCVQEKRRVIARSS